MPKAMFIDLQDDIYDLHGIYSLSAALKAADIEVGFARGRDHVKLLKAIIAFSPDILLYSALSTDIPSYIEFDAEVKELVGGRMLSLIGGPGVTFDPGCIKGSTIDAGCMGEGEIALPSFIRSNYKSAKNVFYRDEPLPREFHPFVDLDRLPLPDRALVYDQDPLVRDNPSKQFISGRGCPYQCTYCFNHEYNRMFAGCGNVVRKKSVSYLLEEIHQVRLKYPLANVVFNDDTFIVDRKWFAEFAARFSLEIGLPYTCNIRANLMDAATARLLKESGCVAVNWSIESGNDHIRNTVLKRNMSREQILTAAKLLTESGIPYRIGNVIALPGETIPQILETLELNIEAQPAYAIASIFMPFPGLEITRYAIERGYYDPASCGGLPPNMFTRSLMNMSPEDNLKVQRIAYLFPIFVNCPWLYRSAGWRNFLFGLPAGLLRIVYHLYNTYKMMRLYRVRSSLMHRLRMARRYFAMLGR